MNASFFLFPLLLPLGIVSFVFFVISTAQKHAYKGLIDRFKSSDVLKNPTRIQLFQYGLLRVKNASKVEEQNNSLLIKTFLVPLLQIDYNSFSEIEKKEYPYSQTYFVFKFKDPSFKNLLIQLKPDDLNRFPVLQSKLGTNSSPSLPPRPSKESPQLSTPSMPLQEAGHHFGNVLRGVIVAIALVALLSAYVTRYGLPF